MPNKEEKVIERFKRAVAEALEAREPFFSNLLMPTAFPYA